MGQAAFLPNVGQRGEERVAGGALPSNWLLLAPGKPMSRQGANELQLVGPTQPALPLLAAALLLGEKTLQTCSANGRAKNMRIWHPT